MIPATIVARADPAMPIAGIGPKPRMKTGLRMMSSTTFNTVFQNGVTESPTPRSDDEMSTMTNDVGIVRKITRR